MKILTGVIGVFLLTNLVIAQNIDQARMSRDIKIAEDIINSMLNKPERTINWHSNQVSGSYIPDYGVIFNIPSDGKGWPLGVKLWDGENGHIVISNRFKIDDGKMKESGEDQNFVTGIVDNYENFQQARDEYLENLMVAFLMDYADLIGQLGAGDKIMIKSEQKLNNIFVLGSGGKYGYGFDFSPEDEGAERYEEEVESDCCDGVDDYILSAEVVKSDLSAYRSGKIDRSELRDRIQIKKAEAYSKKEPELELLSSIFRRLYKSDLSNTFFATQPPKYNRIANFGVIYQWQTYSSNIVNGKHNMPTIDSFDLSIDQRNKHVERLYPLFLEQFKQQLVEYGRTLKGLEPDEILMFKITLTQCKECSIPQSVDLSVKRSVLDDFERQKLDLSSAANKVSVLEHRE